MRAAKSRRLVRLRNVAVHEAAHAVAALFCGVGFLRVTIKPDEGRWGHITYNHPRWWRYTSWGDHISFPRRLSGRRQAYYEAFCIVCHAGPYAETKVTRRKPGYGAGVDKGFIREVSRIVNLSVMLQADCDTGIIVMAEAHARYFECVARQVVKRCWSAILTVAAALLECETLSRRDVIRIASPLLPAQVVRG